MSAEVEALIEENPLLEEEPLSEEDPLLEEEDEDEDEDEDFIIPGVKITSIASQLKEEAEGLLAWANTQLSKRDLCADTMDDFNDGVLLINLVEIVLNSNVGRYKTQPTWNMHKLENIQKVLDLMQKNGVNTTYLNSTDLALPGKDKVKVNLLWLILKHHIEVLLPKKMNLEKGAKKRSAREMLIHYINEITPETLPITDLSRSLADGIAMCYLVDNLTPGHIVCSALNATYVDENLALALKIGDDILGIPTIVDIEDFKSGSRMKEKKIQNYINLLIASGNPTSRNADALEDGNDAEATEEVILLKQKVAREKKQKYEELIKLDQEYVQTKMAEIEILQVNMQASKDEVHSKEKHMLDMQAKLDKENARLEEEQRAMEAKMAEYKAMADDSNSKELEEMKANFEQEKSELAKKLADRDELAAVIATAEQDLHIERSKLAAEQSHNLQLKSTLADEKHKVEEEQKKLLKSQEELLLLQSSLTANEHAIEEEKKKAEQERLKAETERDLKLALVSDLDQVKGELSDAWDKNFSLKEEVKQLKKANKKLKATYDQELQSLNSKIYKLHKSHDEVIKRIRAEQNMKLLEQREKNLHTIPRGKRDFNELNIQAVREQRTCEAFMVALTPWSGPLLRRRPNAHFNSERFKKMFFKVNASDGKALYYDANTSSTKSFTLAEYSHCKIINNSPSEFTFQLVPIKTKSSSNILLELKSATADVEETKAWFFEINRRILAQQYIDKVNNLSITGVKEILEFVLDTSLSDLVLVDRAVGIQESFLALNKALYFRPNFTKLVLDNTSIGDAQIEMLVGIIENSATLEHLGLADNLIGPDGAKILAKALMRNQSVKEIDLSNNQLRDKGCTTMAVILTMHTNLMAFNLSGNHIGDQGIIAFCGGLVKSGTKQGKPHTFPALDFKYNMIGDQGVKAITVLCCQNPTIVKLDLSFNVIGNAGAMDLANAITLYSTSLVDINLASNQISSKGMAPLVVAMNKISRQISLDFSSNMLIDRNAILALTKTNRLSYDLIRVTKSPSLQEADGEGFIENIAHETQYKLDHMEVALGVTLKETNEETEKNTKVYVDLVEKGGSFEFAGVLPGDQIKKINRGEKLSTVADFRKETEALKPGEEFILTISRNKIKQQIKVTAGAKDLSLQEINAFKMKIAEFRMRSATVRQSKKSISGLQISYKRKQNVTDAPEATAKAPAKAKSTRSNVKNFLLDGQKMTMFSNPENVTKEEVFIYYDPKEMALFWGPVGEKSVNKDRSFLLRSITDIYVGKHSTVFESELCADKEDTLCMTLVGSKITLNICASSPSDRRKWLKSVKYWLKHCGRKMYTK